MNKHNESNPVLAKYSLAELIAAFLCFAFGTHIQAQVADTFNPVVNDGVYAMAVQPDGKIIIGGIFSTVQGQTRPRLARLNADGSLDASFASPFTYGYVYSVALQPDGKILVGGEFQLTTEGQTYMNLCRLHADGTVQSSFKPDPNSTVYSLALQPDGKIFVGGYYSMIGGQTRRGLARLTWRGNLDTTFTTEIQGEAVYALAIQPDGKLLVGGSYTGIGGTSIRYLSRLNENGSVETGFNPNPSYSVYCLAMQADGRIVIGGSFSNVGAYTRNYVARLYSNGTVDTVFDPVFSSSVLSMALQGDGKLIAGGYFYSIDGVSRNYVGRLHTDGTLDTNFNAQASGSVYGVALQGDGKVLICGYVYSLGGQSRSQIGRLNNLGAPTETLSYINSTMTWLRGGTSPEVGSTTLEICENGIDWRLTGVGTRVPGGWRFTGVELGETDSVRVRGTVRGDIFLHQVGWWKSITGHCRCSRSRQTAPRLPGAMRSLVSMLRGQSL